MIMILQNTISNLRERSPDERKTIAGIVAIGVVTVLFIGWAFIYFHKIQNRSIEVPITAKEDAENLTASANDAWQNLVSGFQEAKNATQPGYVNLNKQSQ